MTVSIPTYGREEIAYVLQVILTEILGIHSYHIIEEETEATIITWKGKQVCIKNAFFDAAPYLGNIDKMSKVVHHTAYGGHTLLGFYGTNKWEKTDDKVTIYSDILAAAYFMLSRWEEYGASAKDQHQRFDASAAFAVKNRFLHRPIVNEYAEWIAQMFEDLGAPLPISRPKVGVTMSHDIDMVKRWKTVFSWLKAVVKSPWQALGITSSYIHALRDEKQDPYYNFEYLLAMASKYGVPLIFYFKNNTTNHPAEQTDYTIGEPKIRAAIDKIREAGQVIGLHPSYKTMGNSAETQAEKERMEQTLQLAIKHSRQDYLRIEMPTTYVIMDALGITTESSMAYSDHVGFRTGTCHLHSVFNVQTKQTFQVKNHPLAGMMYMSTPKSLDTIGREFKAVVDQIVQYHGNSQLLWHNTDLLTEAQQKTYENIMEYIAQKMDTYGQSN